MKVLMTTDCVGGVWNYSLELVRALHEYEVEVVLAVMGGTLRPSHLRELHSLPPMEVHEGRFKLEWMENPWEEVRQAGDWLLDLNEKSGAELIHLNQFCHGSIPWRRPVLMVGHSDVVSWWQAVHSHEPPSPWNQYREQVGAGLRNADCVIAPSLWMLQSLNTAYGPFKTSRVIPNGRSLTPSSSSEKEDFILTVGRLWDEAKNIPVLEQAARHTYWPVQAAGNPSPPEGPSSLFKNMDLLGELPSEELQTWFGKAWIYAAPALYEPFGLSILEAALHGCALVLGDIPSLRENWDEAAIFVNPRDPVALARAINSLIENFSKRQEYALLARERAGLFSASKMGAVYWHCYQTLLNESPKRGS
jgi:glycosyltransferase involved in cell wall biosynthesis